MATPIKPQAVVTLKPAPFDIPAGVRDGVETRFSLVRVPRVPPACTVRQAVAIIRRMASDDV